MRTFNAKNTNEGAEQFVTVDFYHAEMWSLSAFFGWTFACIMVAVFVYTAIDCSVAKQQRDVARGFLKAHEQELKIDVDNLLNK